MKNLYFCLLGLLWIGCGPRTQLSSFSVPSHPAFHKFFIYADYKDLVMRQNIEKEFAITFRHRAVMSLDYLSPLNRYDSLQIDSIERSTGCDAILYIASNGGKSISSYSAKDVFGGVNTSSAEVDGLNTTITVMDTLKKQYYIANTRTTDANARYVAETISLKSYNDLKENGFFAKE